VDGLSGIDALAGLSGTSGEIPPIRVLFLAHRVSASGRLWMTRGVEMRTIDLRAGQIVGCSGFQDLLEGHVGERQWSLSEWAEVLNSDGLDEALSVVGEALCARAIQANIDGDWILNFVAAADSDPDLLSVPLGLSEMVQRAIKHNTPAEDVRSWLEGAAASGLVAHRPTDADVSQWGLSSKSLSLLEAVENNPSVGSLFVEVGVDGWGHLGVLWQLGLLSVAEVADLSEPVDFDSEVFETEEVSEGPAPDEPEPTRSHQAETSPRSTKPEGKRARPRAGRTKKKRRLDPRLVALKRNPSDSPPDQVEAHLKEAYDVLKSVRPEVIFRVKKSESLSREYLDKRHREACARYHPDRYRGSSQGVQSLAEGCFTAVSDAYHALQDPEYIEALRIRFIEKETGKKVVTDKTRSRAKVDFAKADALFKQRRYDNAFRMSASAMEGDPDRWQYQYLYFRAGYRSGEVDLEDVVTGILSLQGMTTVEKGDQIYNLGEILLREGEDKRAYKMFKQAVSLDEQNVGAIRRLRLRDRREKESKERQSGGGLFGGLFQRRK